MPAKQCRKTATIAKQEQMVNKADSSAHGKANPCGHPAWRFIGNTTGRIDSRLTLPKLHLATSKNKRTGEVHMSNAVILLHVLGVSHDTCISVYLTQLSFTKIRYYW